MSIVDADGGCELRAGDKVSISPSLLQKEIYKSMVNEKIRVGPLPFG
jgi:hypothetical protein